MKEINRTIHATWAQGEDAMPEKFRRNLDMWRAAMPDWDLHVWDTRQAIDRWEDFGRIEKKCYHHATRSDLIQSRVLRDIGGIYIGTDSTPAAGLPRYVRLIESVEEAIVTDIRVGAAMNCLAFSRGGGSKFWSCVANHQMRGNNARLGDRNVHSATGPGCIWEALKAHQWPVHMIPMMEAYTHHWNGSYRRNPDAYCDPGYAASWQK